MQCEIAKTEESTRAEMQVIREGEQNTELYSVRSKKKAVSFAGPRQASSTKHSHPDNDLKDCSPCTSKPHSVVVLDVKTNMTVMRHAQLHMPSTCTARKQGTFTKYA